MQVLVSETDLTFDISKDEASRLIRGDKISVRVPGRSSSECGWILLAKQLPTAIELLHSHVLIDKSILQRELNAGGSESGIIMQIEDYNVAIHVRG